MLQIVHIKKTFNEDVLREIDKIIMDFFGGYRGQTLANTYNKLTLTFNNGRNLIFYEKMHDFQGPRTGGLSAFYKYFIAFLVFH